MMCRLGKLAEKLEKLNVFFLILLISFIIAGSSILGGSLEYAGNDDTFRNLMSVGAFGEQYSYYIPFSNVLYGIPIYILNHMIPHVNWYYWIMIAIDVLAISVLCYILFMKSGIYLQILLSVIVNLIFSRDFYVAIQFTKTASLWIIVGITVLIYYMMNDSHKWLWGSAFLLVGIASRSDCLVMVLPFAICYGIAIFIERKGKINKSDIKRLLFRLSLTCAMITSLFISEYIFRKCNSEWEYYWKYNGARAYLMDHMSISYDHDSIAYDEIGTDCNDITLYNEWLFGDTDFYDLEWLYEVTDIEKEYNEVGLRVNIDVIYEALSKLVSVFNRTPFRSWGIIALGLIMCIVLIIRKQLVSKILGITYFGGMVMAYWYFACVNRFMWRAECGVFLAIIVFSALYINTFSNGYILERLRGSVNSNKSHCFLLLWLVLSFGIMAFYSILMVYTWRYDKHKNFVANEADISGRLEKFLDEDQNTYLLTDFYVTNNPVGLCKARWGGLYENTVYLGAWIIPSPTALYYAKERGIDNPMIALVEKDDVYLHCLDQYIPYQVGNHLSKVLGKKVEVNQVEEQLWKYTVIE